MNKKLILIALSAMMFCSLSYAQKVIKSGDAVIIDCSNMDRKFYDSNKKTRTTDATNTTFGTGDANDISSSVTNAKVYKKFEVHKTDNHEGTDWRNAIDVCSNLTGDWRLPTQRELMLMLILKDKLKANGISLFDPGLKYWSATQSTAATYAVYIPFGSTDLIRENKTYKHRVRCIRDL